jgi:hypothetical protein
MIQDLTIVDSIVASGLILGDGKCVDNFTPLRSFGVICVIELVVKHRASITVFADG